MVLQDRWITYEPAQGGQQIAQVLIFLLDFSKKGGVDSQCSGNGSHGTVSLVCCSGLADDSKSGHISPSSMVGLRPNVFGV
jgi:hypothetical protein